MLEDDDAIFDLLNDIPPEIFALASSATNDLLPEKSRERYENCLRAFQLWKSQKSVAENEFSEITLLAYFKTLHESKRYAPTTLWSIYSMLKATINVKHSVNIENHKQVLAFLKAKMKGYEKKKSAVFTAQQISSFLKHAPDQQYLAHKVGKNSIVKSVLFSTALRIIRVVLRMRTVFHWVVLVIAIYGCARCVELKSLRLEDVETHGAIKRIRIRPGKTAKGRSCVVDHPNFIDLINRYQSMRPKKLQSNQLFFGYHNGRSVAQVMGKNRMALMPREIASFLQLPNPQLHTGHAFRRTSATLAVDAGATELDLQRIGGWESPAVAREYVEESLYYRNKTAHIISDHLSTNTEDKVTGSSFFAFGPSATSSRPPISRQSEVSSSPAIINETSLPAIENEIPSPPPLSDVQRQDNQPLRTINSNISLPSASTMMNISSSLNSPTSCRNSESTTYVFDQYTVQEEVNVSSKKRNEPVFNFHNCQVTIHVQENKL